MNVSQMEFGKVNAPYLKIPVQGGFQLLDLIIKDLLKIQGLSLVEILFVKKTFTRFALQSECCNFNQ